MYSFYGGRKGQDFSIAMVFSTRVEMEADLAKGWTSPIPVASYVMISYGLPSDPNYATYRDQDIEAYGVSYNSTLWQKIYNEDEDMTANGLSYQLIASLTGNTPRISIDKPIAVLDADEDPDVDINSTNPDDVVVTFKLPQSQVITQATTTPIDADQNPSVDMDVSNINQPILEFQLPVAQQIQQGDTEVLNANENPSFEIDSSNINQPILSFKLPQSQIMAQPNLVIGAPNANPAISWDESNINSPRITFTLPQAVEFFYGDLLGERTEGTYELTDASFENYNVGDYYINAATGFIYLITQKNGNTCTFQYVASIQQPLPEVTTSSITPYQESGGDYIPNSPVVTRTLTNNEGTAWALDFALPQAPTFSSTVTFVGVDEQGNVETDEVSTSEVQIALTIPRGAKLFAGTEVSGVSQVVIEGAKPGDVYLNTSTGYLYKLDSAGTWNQQEGTIQGPAGDALHIVASYTINETAELSDSLANGVSYIEQNYSGEINDEDIFAVTWVGLEDGNETAYWYYRIANGTWGRVQLTGGISGLIESTYNDESNGPETNRAYSINYINTLIGGDIASKDSSRVTYSAEQIEELLSWGTF